MNNEIVFKKNGVVSVSFENSPVSVHHFGGVEFRGPSLVDYEIVRQKEESVHYAYLEVSQDKKTAVLFDDMPYYKFKPHCFQSDGFKVELTIEIEDGIELDLPSNRLLTLKMK